MVSLLFCHLSCCFKHIFSEDAVAFGRGVYKNVRNRTDELAILDYRAARHARVNIGPTHFYFK